MKKLFGVLICFVLVLGCVFAAGETHTLIVKATVEETLPAFRLGVASSATSTTAATNNDIPSTVNLTTGAYTATYDSGIHLDEGGSITVQAQLVNPAKTNNGYTLTFTGGTFAVKRNKVDGTLAPSSITTSASGISTGITSIVADDTNEKLVVTFSGETATGVSISAPTILGTVVYTYPADTTIDPNLDGEKYSATIVMTITSAS
jgi:hypothetical protein